LSRREKARVRIEIAHANGRKTRCANFTHVSQIPVSCGFLKTLVFHRRAGNAMRDDVGRSTSHTQ
jgi:hypothetical protein